LFLEKNDLLFFGLVLISINAEKILWDIMLYYKITGDLLTISFQGVSHVAQPCSGKRSAVTEFSTKSKSRMCRYLRSCTSDYRYFVTLTYPSDPSTWNEFRVHFKKFIERLRTAEYLAGSGSLFWFVEYQRRGAPHFHLYTTFHIGKYWLSKNWFECVGSNDRRHKLSGTSIERVRKGKRALRCYAAKYASKSDQKNLQILSECTKSLEYSLNVDLSNLGKGRWWGVVGDRSVVAARTIVEGAGLLSEREVDFIKQVDSVIGKAILYNRINYFVVDSVRCFEFKDDRTAKLIFYLITQWNADKLCLLNAHTRQIVRENATGLQKMLVASRAAQYRMVSQRAI
jgi:hypothetical protein